MYSDNISGNCLLVSHAATNTELLRRAMQQFAIAGEACDDPEVARRLIASRKYEAVVIDFELGGVARQILREVRSSPSNRRSVVFALVNHDSEANEAFVSGSSFTLSKPVLEENAVRLIRAAYGMILRERRRYFRCPVTVPVRVVRAGNTIAEGSLINISEGGLALQSPTRLVPEEPVFAQFTLPGTKAEVSCQAVVCWTDGRGQAGLEIQSVPPAMKAEMENWLARRMDESIPPAVTSRLEAPPTSRH